MKQRNDVSRAAGDKLNLSDRIKDVNPVQNPVRPRTEDGGQSESETHEFAFDDQDNKDKGSCSHPERVAEYTTACCQLTQVIVSLILLLILKTENYSFN